jgi:hypothetical protein
MAAEMMQGQFTSPIVLRVDPATQKIPVAGPLKNVDPAIHAASIVCVLVQGDRNPVWVEGRGEWKQGDSEWSGWVNPTGRRVDNPGDDTVPLQPDAEHARGIAIAIAVKDATEEIDATGKSKFVPPSIVTLTWCVDVELDDGAAA